MVLTSSTHLQKLVSKTRPTASRGPCATALSDIRSNPVRLKKSKEQRDSRIVNFLIATVRLPPAAVGFCFFHFQKFAALVAARHAAPEQ